MNEGEFDIFLDVDFRALALVEHFAILAAIGAHIADPSLDLGHELAAAPFEHLSEIVIPILLRRRLSPLCRRHTGCRSFPLRAPCYVQL